MILAACGGRGEAVGKRMLRGWQGPKAGREVGGGEGGQEGRWVATGGGVETGRGNLEGGNGEGEMGRGAIGDEKTLAMERGTR